MSQTPNLDNRQNAISIHIDPDSIQTLSDEFVNVTNELIDPELQSVIKDDLDSISLDIKDTISNTVSNNIVVV